MRLKPLDYKFLKAIIIKGIIAGSYPTSFQGHKIFANLLVANKEGIKFSLLLSDDLTVHIFSKLSFLCNLLFNLFQHEPKDESGITKT